jgi:dynein heavy chain
MPPPTGTSHIRDYHIIVHTHLKIKKAKGKGSKKRLPGEDEESEYEDLNEATKYQLPTVLLSREWLIISPRDSDFYVELMTTINEGLNTLQSFERWSRHHDISEYVNVLEEWDDKVADDK